MWRPWAKPTVKIRCPSPSPSPFSFKDIQTLCSDTDSPQPACNSPSIFHRPAAVTSSALLRSSSLPPQEHSKSNLCPSASPDDPPPPPAIPDANDRIVIYFTSLRVVRPTFEACSSVRTILRGFRVKIDERDVSIDSAFSSELQRILGDQGKWSLPRVFIGGRYIGGAEEVNQLHEVGELKKLVEVLPLCEPEVCDVCGGF